MKICGQMTLSNVQHVPKTCVFKTSYCYKFSVWWCAEIIARVAARENPPFRPVVGTRDCPEELAELMERCWSDSPDDRPTFEMIRSIIRNIRKWVYGSRDWVQVNRAGCRIDYYLATLYRIQRLLSIQWHVTVTIFTVNFKAQGFVIVSSKVKLLCCDGPKNPSDRVSTALARIRKYVPKQKVHAWERETRRMYRVLEKESFWILQRKKWKWPGLLLLNPMA